MVTDLFLSFLLHAGISAALMAGMLFWAHLSFEKIVISVFLLGLYKEAYDLMTHGQFSLFDMAFNILGMVIGLAMYVLIFIVMFGSDDDIAEDCEHEGWP